MMVATSLLKVCFKRFQTKLIKEYSKCWPSTSKQCRIGRDILLSTLYNILGPIFVIASSIAFSGC